MSKNSIQQECAPTPQPNLGKIASRLRQKEERCDLVCPITPFSALVELINIRRVAECEKDLEILLLRQQMAILERKLNRPPRISADEKLILAVLTTKLKQVSGRTTRQLGDILRLFKPATVLRWHRDLVARRWTFKRKNPGGRPPKDRDSEQLIVRLARENIRWGYGKLRGELLKLGQRVGETTIANILRRHGILPAPQRAGSGRWRQLMRHYKDQILACDFFTVDTLFLQTVYALFFIELGSRRVHFAGCTSHPDAQWVTQQARQVLLRLEAEGQPMHFVIYDRDTKFTDMFDTVFQAASMHILLTPFRAPNANACAERWARTVREECLNQVFLINEAHLRRVMRDYIAYYNQARPHQGIHQQIPMAQPPMNPGGEVRRRDVLGGVIHDYYRVAA